MSDSIEGKPVLRRLRTAKAPELPEIELDDLEDDDAPVVTIVGVLQVIGSLALAGAVIGLLAAIRAENAPGGIAVVASGVVSGVSLFWMARVLETLQQIRDRLKG